MGMRTTQYGYEPLRGQLASILDLNGNGFTYTYDAQGNLQGRTLPGGIVETRGYDLESRLVFRQVMRGAETLRHVGYEYDRRGKLTELQAGALPFRSEYTGLGAVVEVFGGNNEVVPPNPPDRPAFEAYSVDPLGNTVYTRMPLAAGGTEILPPTDDRTYTHTSYHPYGAVAQVVTTDSIRFGEIPQWGERIQRQSTYEYDDAGAQRLSFGWRGIEPSSTDPLEWLTRFVEETHSYYDWDGRLRVVDQTKCVVNVQLPNECRWEQEPFEYEPGPVFEEYRYDALGRRVMVRSRPDSVCGASCSEHLDLYVWDGEELVFEHRYPDLAAAATGGKYRRVAYTQGPGIDRPVSLVYMEGGGVPEPIVLHANAQGLLDLGTRPDGTTDPFLRDLEWAGVQSPAYPKARTYITPAAWRGSLIPNKRDASGLLFMRNRYYDPATGQFTQEDPIGLAGGMNTYGFAGGDPVNLWDPFGLCPKVFQDATGECPEDSATGAFPDWFGPGGMRGVSRAIPAAGRFAQGVARSGGSLRMGMAAVRMADEFALANRVARATGGSLSLVRTGQGFRVAIPHQEGEVLLRVMFSGGGRQHYWRMSLSGKGSLTRQGAFSADPSLTHTPLVPGSFEEIMNVLSRLGAP